MPHDREAADAARIDFDLKGVGSQLRERLLAVPIYQRSFAWTAEEVSEFWDDLRSAFNEGLPEYFLGTIVLTRQAMPGVAPVQWTV